METGHTVRPHIDIYSHQIVVKSDSESDDSAVEMMEPPVKKKFDLSAELSKLYKQDLDFVDKGRATACDVTEVEAQAEEKEYQINALKKSLKSLKRKKSCAYILQEAGEDNTVYDSSNETDSTSDISDGCDATYQSSDIPPPIRGEGGVPNCKKTYEKIDEAVYEMSSEDRLLALIEECQNCFPAENCDTGEKNQLQKFCQHEVDFDTRETLFSNLDSKESKALRQFALYILQPKFKNSVFFGMYSSGFDNHFIFLELMKMGVRVTPIYRGNKLITFTIPALNITFLDFFCFVPSSLKNLEKSFGLKIGGKGYFPHLLNQPKHYGLRLAHLPPKMYYEPGIDFMNIYF